MKQTIKDYQARIDKLEASEALHRNEARDARTKCEDLQRGKIEEEKQRKQAL